MSTEHPSHPGRGLGLPQDHQHLHVPASRDGVIMAAGNHHGGHDHGTVPSSMQHLSGHHGIHSGQSCAAQQGGINYSSSSHYGNAPTMRYPTAFNPSAYDVAVLSQYHHHGAAGNVGGAGSTLNATSSSPFVAEGHGAAAVSSGPPVLACPHFSSLCLADDDDVSSLSVTAFVAAGAPSNGQAKKQTISTATSNGSSLLSTSAAVDGDAAGGSTSSGEAATKDAPPHVRFGVLTSAQGKLVRESFELIRETAHEKGLIMYLTIFDMVPESKILFSAIRGSTVPTPVNEKLQAHGALAFKMMCEAFCKWDDPAEVDKATPFFKALGGRHLKYGIDADDFPIFRMGFMKSLRKAFGKRWLGELEEAWVAGFDILEAMSSEGMADLGGKKEIPDFMKDYI